MTDLRLAIAEVLASGGPVEDEIDAADQVVDVVRAWLLEPLERRRVVTIDPAERGACCGLPRDADGFCVHRPHHPIAVRA